MLLGQLQNMKHLGSALDKVFFKWNVKSGYLQTTYVLDFL